MKAVLLAISLLVPALSTSAAPAQRIEAGNRISENIPEIPAALNDQLQRYANTRSASLGGWLSDGSGVLIATRFANTAQVHRVKMPGGAREQLTFYDEPIASLAANPKRAGFVFGKDVGGSEFWQLYWFDLATRDIKLLTDGKSRNGDPVWSHDGTKLAYTSTERNGKDTDVWVLDLASGERKAVVTEGGSWQPSDFSPDGAELLVSRFVSINEVYPGAVHLGDNKLRMFPIDGGKAAFGEFRFARDGKGAYFTSDERSEFLTLRFHDFATNKVSELTRKIPWDVEEFALSEDGSRIAFVTNEDGFGVLHVIDTASRAEQSLPALPKGVISGVEFSPDGKHIAFAVNSALSPNDVYSIDLSANTLARWTESEVGGLDTSKFVEPTLVHFRPRARRDVRCRFRRSTTSRRRRVRTRS